MIATILALFVFGTLWFWGLLLLDSILFIWCVEDKHLGLGCFVVLVTAALLSQNWAWLVGQPWWVYASVGLGYIAVGGVWSVWRWFRYVRKAVDEFKQLNVEYTPVELHVPDYQYEVMSGTRQNRCINEAEVKMIVRRNDVSRGLREAICPRDNKEQITLWGVFWPWSILWSCIGDVCEFMWDMLVQAYTSITKRALDSLTVKP